MADPAGSARIAKADTAGPRDIAIIGGGLAGLSLAVRLCDPAFAHLRVTVLEPRTRHVRDRTWSYWALDGHPGLDHPFGSAVARRWTCWGVAGQTGPVLHRRPELPYVSIPADRLYDLALARIAAAPNVHLLSGTRVDALRIQGAGVEIRTDRGGVIRSDLVFDSRPPDLRPPLSQRFVGQELRVDRPCFDPGTAMLMDFRTGGGLWPHFLYVLPMDDRTALVESTSIAPPDRQTPDHAAWVRRWLADRHGAIVQDVLFEEAGAIPMAPDLRAEATDGPVIRIGTPGGAVKPSTGYAFLAIQAQAASIAADLRRGRMPRPGVSRPPLAAWMDRVFLSRIQADPRAAPDLFLALFRSCPPDALVRFLNDRARPADYARVMAALPKLPLAGTALRRMLLPQATEPA